MLEPVKVPTRSKLRESEMEREVDGRVVREEEERKKEGRGR